MIIAKLSVRLPPPPVIVMPPDPTEMFCEPLLFAIRA
jgi:hypothetical protein